MTFAEALRAVVAILVGLLLGSALPAEMLARRRGIDIRTVGDGNPGTINAFRVLGLVPGLATAAYDLAVGVFAVRIAFLLGLSESVAYTAGIASVVGHRFPVFGGFRGGGQGMAASTGLLLYGIGVLVSRGALSVVEVAGLVALLLVTYAVARSDVTAAVVMLPLLVITVLLARADAAVTALIAATAIHIWLVQVGVLRHRLASRRARPAHGHSPE